MYFKACNVIVIVCTGMRCMPFLGCTNCFDEISLILSVKTSFSFSPKFRGRNCRVRLRNVAGLHFFPPSFEDETGKESSDVARLHSQNFRQCMQSVKSLPTPPIHIRILFSCHLGPALSRTGHGTIGEKTGLPIRSGPTGSPSPR